MDIGLPDYIFKLILIGDSGVGKSSTLLNFMNKEFDNTHQSTIGIEYGSNMVTYNHFDYSKPSFQVLNIKLTCWDCAGQERFRSVVRSYYRNTAGVIAVFDLTNRQSFENLRYWLKEMDEVRGKDMVSVNTAGRMQRYPPVLLVGNKKDLPNQEVTRDEALQFAAEFTLDGYIETSARTGDNVANTFREIAKIIFSHILERGQGLEGVTNPYNRNPEWYELEKYRNKSCNC